ncbi:MAG TPA: 16S rRNA (guanine(527)-N(7))-methyltransferase RsmG [Pyrinomonadaceae bacterium]|jgi:16S rRNA (guanine527-N7)-methyltransferase
MTATRLQAEAFTGALRRRAARYGVEPDAQAIEQLQRYYEQVQAWNARLHLVAPCPPEEFATRHVLESLVALPFLAEGARVADVGSGAGLPIIPCLILRPDLSATLIEASTKKAVFLREALRGLNLGDAARVINRRFETTEPLQIDSVTCRALDRFTEMIRKLLRWSPAASTLLLFGGPTLRAEMDKHALNYTTVRMPESEQRFLFVVKERSDS